jgi:alkylated DNA nucleotide flippase Atl1
MRNASRPGLPYHRVVAAGGKVGGYGSAPHVKVALLRAEAVQIRGQRILDFRKRKWSVR